MAEHGTDGASALMDGLLKSGEAFVTAASQRIARASKVLQDISTLLDGPHAAGVGPLAIFAASSAVAVVAILVFLAVRRLLEQRQAGAMRRLWLPLMLSALAGVALGFVMSGGPGPYRRTLLLAALAAPLALMAQAIVARTVLSQDKDRSEKSLADFANLIGLALGYGVFGIAVNLILREMRAGPGLRDLVATFFVALPIGLVAITAYSRKGAAVGYSLARGWSGSKRLQRLGLRWPRIAIGLIALAIIVQQIAITVAAPLPGLAFLTTLGAALLWPHIDAALASWAADGLEHRRVPSALVATRRTARPALAIVIASALIAVWGRPIVALTGVEVGGLLGTAIGVAAILLFSAFLWNLIGAGVDRVMSDDGGHDAAGSAIVDTHAPRSRLGTLLPLIAGTAKIAILALTALTVLLALGVNVWPLVTGLSVFGLAIGFGSQTLVKDVVSGIFFLADDAFRLGEYVETSGAKGNVEKISIRSVSLRHPRGALATIPYGQIGKIQNFSRDWVIEKLTFRVAFDTDIDKVKKLFKQIGQQISEDPELARDLVEPFKSQGIGAVEDNTIILRGKFKAKAGQQFAIRKAVLAQVQKAFQENGIRTVPRPLPLS
jgi:moderate conductance mechanosensitive channel